MSHFSKTTSSDPPIFEIKTMESNARIIPSMGYHEAKKMIQWLTEAFGFEEKSMHETEEGKVAHAELTYRGNMIMIGSSDSGSPFSALIKHPADIGGFETQSPYIIIDDDEIEGHYERAKQHGATIVIDLKAEDYGGKNYSCYDPEGHLWSFGSYNPWKSPQ